MSSLFVFSYMPIVLFRMQKTLERISRIVDAVKKLSSNQFPRLFQALYIALYIALYKGHLHIINHQKYGHLAGVFIVLWQSKGEATDQTVSDLTSLPFLAIPLSCGVKSF